MLVAGKPPPACLADLLFAGPTVPGTTRPDAWRRQLDEFIAARKGRSPGPTCGRMKPS